MRWTAVSLCLVAVAGCDPDRIIPTASELRLGRSRVEFPRAFVGQVTQAEVEVINMGLVEREIQLVAPAPFSVLQAPLTLPGASSTAIRLAFAPEAVGAFESDLTVESEDEMLKARLVGTGAADLVCSELPCRTSRFDPAEGRCIDSARPDGTACGEANACVIDGHCTAGECRGQARNCDDGDACTTDVCEAGSGCVHFPATARCGASTDPCKVPACDPQRGCVFADAPDGTRCGPADCSTADICIVGVCRRQPVVEGAPCGEASPCQARGRCSHGACMRPPPAELTPLWTAWAPQGHRVSWDAIGDVSGNVYWREADGLEERLVSVTAQGVSRYRVSIAPARQVSLIGDVLVLRRDTGVEGRRARDGAPLWTRDFSAPPMVATVKTVARGVGGSLYVGYARAVEVALIGSTVVSLNVFDGAPLWQVDLEGQRLDEQTMPADELGHIYLGTVGNDGRRRYVGLSASGAVRWSRENPHASPAAVFGGRVYHWDHWLSETSDGRWVNAEPPSLSTSGFPRLALGAISYVGSERRELDSCAEPGSPVASNVFHLVRVDPASSSVRWSREISGVDGGGQTLTNPVLTARSNILFSQTLDYCGVAQYVLREISAAGESSFSCLLPSGEHYVGEGLLLPDRWLSAVRSRDGGFEGVRAFAVPGFDLPEHGWATAWGSPARDNHAR